MEDHLLIKYIRKEITPEETNRVDQWLHSSPVNRSYFEELQKTWLKTGNIPELANPDLEKAWNILNDSISKRSFRHTIQLVAKIAAVVLIAVMISSVVWNKIPYFQQEKFTSVLSGDSIRKVVMSDSSIIWLNKHSRLTYGNRYNGKQRNVVLIGEGFFKVHRNTEKPFVISAQGGVVKVLGTSFNVKTDETSGKVMVAVVTGKVSFREEAKIANEAILTPNQVAELKPGNTIHIKYVTSINDNAWLTRKLTFQNQTWAEITDVLETFYHTKITLTQPEMGTKRISATFDHQSLEEVLSILCNTANYTFTLTNNSVIIHK